MKIKLCVSVLSSFLLLCGLSVLAQDLNVNGNVNLLSPTYAYQIDGNNVLRVFQTASNGSNLYLGKGAGVSSSPQLYPNIFLGNFAGHNDQSGIGGSTAVGYAAGYFNLTGEGNTFIGYKAAGLGADPPYPMPAGTGSENTFVGEYAGHSLISGNGNTFLGGGAGYGNTSGNENVAIGHNAGTGNNTGSNNVYLGNRGANESGTIRIGDSSKQTAAYIAGIYGTYMDHGRVVFVDSNGRLGTTTGSDPLAEMQETIRSQEQRIASLEQRLAQMEALMGKK